MCWACDIALGIFGNHDLLWFISSEVPEMGKIIPYLRLLDQLLIRVALGPLVLRFECGPVLLRFLPVVFFWPEIEDLQQRIFSHVPYLAPGYKPSTISSALKG